MKTTTKRTIKRSTKSAVPTKRAVKSAKEGSNATISSNLGLKEQVKAGLITAGEALTTLNQKGSDAKDSQTYRWLKARALQEGSRKKVTSEVSEG